VHKKNRLAPLLIAAVLASSILACNMPAPTTGIPSITITPFTAPTTAPTTALTPIAPATIPPTDAPLGWLPTGALALYKAGPWESPGLHALAADGSTADLGREVQGWTTVSRTGRWIAHSDRSSSGDVVAVSNLETDIVHTIPLTADFTLYGSAFDRAESRLAFLELGSDGAGGYNWAIVVVSLSDGSTTRFDASFSVGAADSSMPLPGNPLGWSAGGEELLLNTFMPDTEGNWAGVWGIALPPGTASTALESLSRRQLAPAGGYITDPRLSPDGARLLYLNRDFDYTPAGYEPMGYDLAVNQLWALRLASGERTLLVEVTDGGALARAAAWSPDGARILFAQGSYSGGAFGSLALKIRDGGGAVDEVGPAPLPPGGGLRQLDWCAPAVALAVSTSTDYDHQLYTVNVGSSSASLVVTSEDQISVLGCVR